MKPLRVFVFLCLCLLLTGVAFWLFPREGVTIGDHVWHAPDVQQYLQPQADTLTITLDTVCLLFLPAVERPQTPVYVSDTCARDDTYRWLMPFYLSLGEAKDSTVRVVHYGDSQIEGDRMTMVLRAALQARFGGSGVGLVPLYQTIDSRTTNQYILSGDGRRAVVPKQYLAFGPSSRRRGDHRYGPMGQVSVMDNALVNGSEDLSLRLETTRSYAFEQVRVVATRDTIIDLTDSTTRYTLHLTGKQDVYGVSMECATGIYVDNVALRGCAGTIFTGIDSVALQRYFTDTRTRLIILQFGGNVVPYLTTRKQVEQYAARIGRQLKYLRRCAPEAAILFVGPSDMLCFKDGKRQSYAILPVLDTALRSTIEQEQATYWSLYEAMGGAGAMLTWMQQGLAGKDGIHFTRQGADRAGAMLRDFILQPLTEQPVCTNN